MSCCCASILLPLSTFSVRLAAADMFVGVGDG